MPVWISIFQTLEVQWLSLLGLSVLLTVAHFARSLTPNLLGLRTSRQLLACSSCLMLFLAAGQLIELTEQSYSPSRRPLWTMASLLMTAGACWLQFADGSQSKGQLQRRGIQAMRIVLPLVIAVWSMTRLQVLAKPTNELALIPVPQELHKVFETVAITDRGRVLPVFRVDHKSEELEEQREAVTNYVQELKLNAMQRSPADFESNCHGWVFLRGEYLLTSQSVQTVLEDNGYHLVEQPAPNDVVVYRDPQGHIIHTGLVRGLLNDGTVFVESKWGVAGRYLHEPWNQPYSEQIQYYRTTRPEHRLKIITNQRPRTQSTPQTVNASRS